MPEDNNKGKGQKRGHGEDPPPFKKVKEGESDNASLNVDEDGNLIQIRAESSESRKEEGIPMDKDTLENMLKSFASNISKDIKEVKESMRETNENVQKTNERVAEIADEVSEIKSNSRIMAFSVSESGKISDIAEDDDECTILGARNGINNNGARGRSESRNEGSQRSDARTSSRHSQDRGRGRDRTR